MPLVSIILNVRNGSAFLREALDSVMAQTFTDWELIAWDDCSTDDSARIIAEYNDPRVRYYLSPEDTPLGAAQIAHRSRRRRNGLPSSTRTTLGCPVSWKNRWRSPPAEVGIIYGRTVLFDATHGNLRDYDYSHAS